MDDAAAPVKDLKTDPQGTWRELFAGSHLGVLSILCLGVWLHAADSLLVTTIMPSAVKDIGGVQFLNWTFALYELGSIVAAAATALLVMQRGLRAIMAAASVVYAIGCAASALAPDMATMLGGRLAQGVGGGMLLAATFVGMNRLFPKHLWIKVVALISSVWGASSLVGPLIGGIFASIGFWRGGFWAFGLQAMVLAIAAFWLLKDEPAADDAVANPLPYRRLALLALAIVAIAGAGAHVSSFTTPMLCGVGIICLVLFVRLDGAGTSRMLAPQPLSLSHSAGAGTVMVLATAVATISFVLYGPLLMQVLFDVDPLTAGFIVALESVAWSLGAVAVSSAKNASERAIVRGGSAFVTLGLLGFAVIMPYGPVYALFPFAVLQGAGFGMAWGFVVRLAIADTPAADRDRVSGSMPTVQMIGYALGSAVAGIIANAAGFAAGVSEETARAVGFWIFAAFMPLALVGNLASWRLTAAKVGA
jgi:MFS family permease